MNSKHLTVFLFAISIHSITAQEWKEIKPSIDERKVLMSSFVLDSHHKKIDAQQEIAGTSGIKERLAACLASRRMNSNNQQSMNPEKNGELLDILGHHYCGEASWQNSWPSTFDAKKEIEDACQAHNREPYVQKKFEKIFDKGNYDQNNYIWPSYFQRVAKYCQNSDFWYRKGYPQPIPCFNDPGTLDKSPGCLLPICVACDYYKLKCPDCKGDWNPWHYAARRLKYPNVIPSFFNRKPYRQLEGSKLPIYEKEYIYGFAWGLSTRKDDVKQPFVPGKFIDLSKEFPIAHIQPVCKKLASSNQPVYKQITLPNNNVLQTRIIGTMTTLVPGQFTDQSLSDDQVKKYSENISADQDRFQYYPYISNGTSNEPLFKLLILINSNAALKELYYQYIKVRRNASFDELKSEFISENKEEIEKISKKITDILGKL